MSAPAVRVKLCFICEATAGGVRKHIRELVRTFARPEEGYEIHALLGDRGEPGFQRDLDEWKALGVSAQLLPSLRREISFRHDRRAYYELKAHLRALRPEIVHTHSSKAGFLGRLSAHAAGTPMIVHTPHVFAYQWASGLKKSFYLGLERFAARRCHAIVCVGEGQRAEALRLRLAPESKLVLIPNGVEVPASPAAETKAALRSELHLPGDALVVGMIARLAPQKGVKDFLEAAVRVVKQRADAVFVLAGGGPLEKETRTRAAALGLDRERLRILGHVEDAERLYPAFDVLALSSLYEGLPYVLLEAMACGVPVVATDVQGSRDVIEHGVSGLLARSSDVGDLAQKIAGLLSDETARARLREAALKRVRERFSFVHFVEGHRRLYGSRSATSL